LDRDGTIIEDYPDEEWKGKQTPVFLPGAIEALRFLRGRGYALIVVTNQYLIGEGVITRAEYEAFHAAFVHTLLQNDVELTDVFYCPHARTENCGCRKPKPGMLLNAFRKYPYINREQSFLAGDSEADRLLAQTANLRFFGINMPCASPIVSLLDLVGYL
jgi:D-glycero-D-manno-heptose 1,7-bisphosphate phosphatase